MMPTKFLFTQDALAKWREIEAQMWSRIRELVKRRADEDERRTITPDDVVACLHEAIEQAVGKNAEQTKAILAEAKVQRMMGSVFDRAALTATGS